MHAVMFEACGESGGEESRTTQAPCMSITCTPAMICAARAPARTGSSPVTGMTRTTMVWLTGDISSPPPPHRGSKRRPPHGIRAKLIAGPSMTLTPLARCSTPIACPNSRAASTSQPHATVMADGHAVTPVNPPPTPCGPAHLGRRNEEVQTAVADGSCPPMAPGATQSLRWVQGHLGDDGCGGGSSKGWKW